MRCDRAWTFGRARWSGDKGVPDRIGTVQRACHFVAVDAMRAVRQRDVRAMAAQMRAVVRVNALGAARDGDAGNMTTLMMMISKACGAPSTMRRSYASAGGADDGARAIRIWPSARAVLAAHDIDVARVVASGKHGIITKEDALAAAAGTLASLRAPIADEPPQTLLDDYAFGLTRAQTHEDVAVHKVRKVIASRLSESKREAPHAYADADVDLSDIEGLRARVLADHGVKVSVNDCVMYAVGRALREVPALNAGWDAKTMAAKSFDGVDVCVAVATEDGLITPIVTGADVKSLTAIGADVKALAKKAREGALKPHEFMGGSFSVSNLGMFGVESFSAIINPPQGAILAVGAGVDKVVLVDGAPATKKVMTVRVSTDRRVADEGDSARWLAAFAEQFRKTDQWAIT